jgi:drug/metabolite transporter (DMT)-like permease
MAYLFISIALVFMAVKGYCGKKTSNCMRDTGDSFLFSLVRMIFCILIGLVPLALDGAWADLRLDGGMAAICLLAGASNAAFLVGWILAVQKNTMVMVDVTLTVGSIIPAVLCALLFGEAILWQKMIGFGFIILASLILSGNPTAAKKGSGFLGILLLVLAAVGEGMVSFSQQLYKQYYSGMEGALGDSVYPMSVYHFYTYVFSGALLLVFFLIYEGVAYAKAPAGQKPMPKARLESLRNPILYIVVMAVCLFLANYFQTIATSTYGMPSQIMYPLIKGACLITVNITAMVFFGEKITKRSVLGSLVALLGIIVMNVF